MNLKTAMLYVRDFPRMTAFYADLLGTQPTNTEHTDRWALFTLGGADFALHAIPVTALDPSAAHTHSAPRDRDPLKLTFADAHAAATRRRLEAAGVVVIQRAWQNDGAFDVVDPEGNILQIVPRVS